MNVLFWWVSLILLILLISALVLYFLYDIFRDYFKRSSKNDLTPPLTPLNRYKFDKSDVEDLTKIRGHFRTVIPKVLLVDEVDVPPAFHTPPHSRKYSLLPDIHENIALSGSLYSIEDIMGEVQEERFLRRNSERRASIRSLVTEGMKKKSLASMATGSTVSADSENSLDPSSIETLRAIADVEEDARRVDFDIDSFLGDRNSLRFFEINEKLIRCNIALSEILTPTESLRARKMEMMKFVNQLQAKLKSKV
ncbi:uncharacterized protein LOC143198822 [Rhynchophorus ferrugineus]|uniref:Uncharacterized protein n=1 Tax=Rhynchophorus ferrugineus TaxID=354439 RepID=A0A834MHA2_RHYFE|nr:hypothetical protein GWI33_003068 [Rhynchophorus ferrugineus]